MAKKKSAREAPGVAQRLDTIERLVRSGFRQVDQRFQQVDQRFGKVDQRFEQIDQRFEQIDQRFEQIDQRFEQVDRRFEQVDRRLDILDLGQRELKSEINEKLAVMDERINLLANHVDGFMKLHETLDIEFKVMKEQMSRLEARLNRLEAERST